MTHVVVFAIVAVVPLLSYWDLFHSDVQRALIASFVLLCAMGTAAGTYLGLRPLILFWSVFLYCWIAVPACLPDRPRRRRMAGRHRHAPGRATTTALTICVVAQFCVLIGYLLGLPRKRDEPLPRPSNRVRSCSTGERRRSAWCWPCSCSRSRRRSSAASGRWCRPATTQPDHRRRRVLRRQRCLHARQALPRPAVHRHRLGLPLRAAVGAGPALVTAKDDAIQALPRARSPLPLREPVRAHALHLPGGVRFDRGDGAADARMAHRDRGPRRQP